LTPESLPIDLCRFKGIFTQQKATLKQMGIEGCRNAVCHNCLFSNRRDRGINASNLDAIVALTSMALALRLWQYVTPSSPKQATIDLLKQIRWLFTQKKVRRLVLISH